MGTLNDDLIEKFNQLEELYVKSREAIAMLETRNKSSDAFIGPHNEMRNAFDHVMKMIKDKDDDSKREQEFKGAESHLLRAGYDSFELLAIAHIDYIQVSLSKYSPEDINIAFPAYYKTIRPRVLDIKKYTAELRALKKVDEETGKKTFTYYYNAVDELDCFVKDIDRYLPIIDECHNKRSEKQSHMESKNSKRHRISIAFGIIGVIIGIIVTLLVA